MTSVSTPSPQAGAPCGVVDLLDFPMDPPDAQNIASGGQDFGVFRRRYDKYHAGEDWWASRRGSNFGLPVYSIGHGRVTYAAPLGWGRDQGVIIVRHTFVGGDKLLSFYGHLDPDSVVLDAGECVTRGEQIGQVGRPRTAPHLHFEIRHHMPAEPGPGYWPEDPTLAGWEPPSATIWGQRISSAPGVLWTRPFAARGTQGIGQLTDGMVAVVEDRALWALDAGDGRERWRFPNLGQVDSAMVDRDRARLYVANRAGTLEAYQIGQTTLDSAAPGLEDMLTPLWQLRLETPGAPTLMPLPGGGVIAAVRRQLFAVSGEGDLLWEQDVLTHPADWQLVNDRLVFSTSGQDGSLWTVDQAAVLKPGAVITGQPVFAGNQLFLYGPAGIFRLDEDAASIELLHALPESYFLPGDMVATPGGGLLVTHADLRDQRLIALSPDGRTRWERSIAEIGSRQQGLLVLDGRSYLWVQTNHSASSEYAIYWIDVDRAELRLIFQGGTRSPIVSDGWAVPIDEAFILFNIGGGQMVAFRPQPAMEAVFRGMNIP